LHQLLNLLGRKYVRDGARGFLGTQHSRWQLVTRIFCMRISCESNYDTEPAGSLTRRSTLPGPLEGDIGANVVLALGIRECGEAA
jgi:hypothetical protein